MKKNILLTLLLTLFHAIAAWSGPVDVETARQQAASFFRQTPADSKHRVGSFSRMQLKHVQCQPADEAPLLYVFAPEDGGGYAIIAGEETDNPVLGYSDNAEFISDSIPEGLQYWLDEYSRQLAFLRSLPESSRQSPQRAAYKPSIAPLTYSKWNQGIPYNNLCPIDQQTRLRCVTGCVATAMAQVMYYHAWPEVGSGSHSYECQGQTLTADFGHTTYQWSKMKDTYQGGGDTDNAVATLMFHCGVAVEMDYHSSESAASVWADLLKQYFNYATTARDVARDAVGDSLFEEILYTELAALRPVLFSGSRADYSGGHEFICDGYRDGYFHFNLGWGGYRDDYYRLGSIIPSGTGYNFSYNQYAIVGIQKPGDHIVEDGVTYEVYPDGTAILLEGKMSGDDVVPAEVLVDGRAHTVVSIAPFACANCPDLTSLTIPGTVESVGDSAFFNCPALKKITLEESSSPLSFGMDVFCIEETEGPTALEEVEMNRNIIDGIPFAGAGNLQSLTLGDWVTEIPNACFNSCGALKHLTLPASCRTIGGGAFSYCTQLSIEVASDNPYLYTTDGVLFQREGNVLLFYPYIKEDEAYTVPEGVEELAENAIAWAPLTRLTLPSTLKEVGWASLWLFDLQDIVCLSPTPPATPSYVFPLEYLNETPTLHVPEGTAAAYRAKEPWNRFTIVDDAEATGIEAPIAASSASGASSHQKPLQFYSPDGQRQPMPRRGFNIVRMGDGSVRKVMLR